MTEPILHPATKSALNQFSANPAHGLMIVGPSGSGKSYVAKYLATEVLRSDTIDSYAYFKTLSPEPKSISIEQVRELQTFLSLKVPGKNSIRRVCIIEQAELLTIEAQNALLKILEEPPVDTIIILLTSLPKHLLSTIVSRVQAIQVLPVANDVLQEAFPSQFKSLDDAETQRTLLLAGGRIGLLSALLDNDEHPLRSNIDAAKKFLTADQFERVVMAAQYKEKQDVVEILQALLIISNAALKTALKKNNKVDYARWHTRCSVLYHAIEQVEKNAAPKLALATVALDL